MLADLEKFINSDTRLPLLLKIGMAHAQFETIHPFLDGNGHVGRQLITLLLCEQQVLRKPVLYLSHFFKERRQEYNDYLQAVRDSGAWEEWLVFSLRGAVEVSEQATETARRILTLREEDRLIITERLGRAAANGHRVLEHLYEHPIVSVNGVAELTSLSYAAANNLVARMVEGGILREVTGQSRNRQFMYDRYVNLFQDPLPERD